MTDQTPVERAAAAIDENYNPDQAPILAAMFQDYARTVFESIDTLEMADRASKALREVGLPESFGLHIAVTIKNWLTGKDQQ